METPYKKLYDRLPATLQNLAVTAFSVLLDRQRYGGRFREFQALLEKSQWYDERQLEAYQNKQLQRIVAYAYQHVPYYRQVMDERGLKVADIATSADLHKLPVLTKDIIRTRFADLLSDEFDLKTVARGNTSGTTGSPLEVCYDEDMIRINYAMLDRQYRWADTRLGRSGDKVAVIRGNVIVPLNQSKPPYWRYNYLHRQMLLSSFHLSQDNLPAYVAELRKFNPRVLDGYPSTLYVLAKYLKNKGETLPLHAVLSSSETLYDFQRETIEESFACKVFDYFGAAERVLFATECDQHMGHHVCAEYGITELLDRDLKPVATGETGTLVATSLHNIAMPLIRYVTNDMSALKAEKCSCGRGLPLMEDVATKAEDSLTLKDGRIISPSVLTHPFKPLTTIEESQIIQESLDLVVVKLVPGKGFSEEHTDALVHGLQDRLGAGIEIRIEIVDELERSASGKFKWVISRVALGI
ncbi:phenylacetate--CoA ligase family protein [Woeseia oceani]|uniref:Capsule biosynthesis protein CapK n=1 Tax=Woeseia oceani TaxID=1548547 RepID=A0A193LET3_9GAMM|nr:phenylacetate--CoA ligase family protein [Woeseia oceani]ANO50966.1 hypothetical protein BA177_06865 [Woeseia oceani]